MPAADQTSMKASSLMHYKAASIETTAKSDEKSFRAKSMPNAHELSSASLLWRSVLAQSVKDIYGEDSARLEVIRWVKTRDFETVCDFAHVEHTSMREQFQALLMMPASLARKYGKPLCELIMTGVHRGE